ncbi:cysteine hydrolase [Pasteurellaceae bacterium USgator11]|nr:cysteine hydrolase [Pasteurellaceae bacterium USgator41]TNG94073.1 cysteine hydrolase [Pasteurellaceae bacterium UScroc12]TNG97911.1 cysteine hydrolase [Pasteurellaceae bacterium UScroc31]TNH02045.1 cysteine hydrolase [Pasteurellaceae bacterium USgator11]
MSNEHKAQQIDTTRRQVLGKGSQIAMAATALGAMGLSAVATAKENKASDPYAEPQQYGMPRHGMKLDKKRVALVVVDPQVDFLSPKGISWGVMGESITRNNTVPNIESLFKAAKAAEIPVVVSPHYYYPVDHSWKFGGPGEHFMHDSGMFARKGPYTLEGFEGSGADFMEEYKPYIYDGKTIIASPHKVFGPETNDVVLQLRKQGVDQVILAGMAANLCIESHLREFIEQGFEVTVVKDATAGPKIPEGDGYLAALVNFRLIANDLWTTAETVSKLGAKA